MEHEIVARYSMLQIGQRQQIAFDQREARRTRRLGEKGSLAGREIVVDRDGMTGGQQTIGEIAADKTGPAANECTHENISLAKSTAIASIFPIGGRLALGHQVEVVDGHGSFPGGNRAKPNTSGLLADLKVQIADEPGFGCGEIAAMKRQFGQGCPRLNAQTPNWTTSSARYFRRLAKHSEDDSGQAARSDRA